MYVEIMSSPDMMTQVLSPFMDSHNEKTKIFGGTCSWPSISSSQCKTRIQAFFHDTGEVNLKEVEQIQVICYFLLNYLFFKREKSIYSLFQLLII